MKNIKNYKSEKYDTNNYEEVEESIYKTKRKSKTLTGLTNQEEINKINNLKEWEKPEITEDFYIIKYNGKTYYKDIEPFDEEEIIWTDEEEKTVYVTSMMFEQEPEYEENEPSNKLISQYPLEDILDEFSCYCGDNYDKENESDKINSYVEFVSPNIEDIRNIRTIIGKHVYSIKENDYKLTIE